MPEIPSPENHGWVNEDMDGKNKLKIHWMDGLPAPQAVLKLLVCKCTRYCKSHTCPCMQNGLKCTEMCKHKTKSCGNYVLAEEDECLDMEEISDGEI